MPESPQTEPRPDEDLPPHERPDFDPMKYIRYIDGMPPPVPLRVRWARFVEAVRRRFHRKTAA